MKKIFLLLFCSLSLIACATSQTNSLSKMPTVPALAINQVLVPSALYSTAKGKSLAVKYQNNLGNIFHNIRAQYSPKDIEFTPLTLLPNEKMTSGLGFFKIPSTSDNDMRYLAISVGTSKVFDKSTHDLNSRISTVINTYFEDILKIMAKEEEAINDKDVYGYYLGLAWQAYENYNQEVEGIIIYTSKEYASDYLNNRISLQKLIDASRTDGFQGNKVLEGLKITLVESAGKNEEYQKSEGPTDCNYSLIQGREIVFREKTPDLQKFGYMDWLSNPNVIGYGNFPRYDQLAKKRGKLQSKPMNTKFGSSYVVILETCEIVYTRTSIDRLQNTGIYFSDELEKVKLNIGENIWVNNAIAYQQKLITQNSNLTHPLLHLEELKILGVETKTFGYGKGGGSFYLLVGKKSGESGFLAYNKNNLFETYPIDPSWNDSIISLIQQRKIRIGMTDEQAVLSWGKPKDINKSVGSWGVHEQWVYGTGQYLYFEDGKLTSFQSSN